MFSFTVFVTTLCVPAGELHVAIKAYKSTEDDEMSLEVGETVEVIHKLLDGWWVVRYDLHTETTSACDTIPELCVFLFRSLRYLVPFHSPLQKFIHSYCHILLWPILSCQMLLCAGKETRPGISRPCFCARPARGRYTKLRGKTCRDRNHHHAGRSHILKKKNGLGYG